LFNLWRIGLSFALAASLSGCSVFFPLGYELGWQETGRETVVDPATGDTVRTFHWRYDDGHVTTTTDVIPRGQNTDRRQTVRPTPPPRRSEP
jgi:hypothetical protein